MTSRPPIPENLLDATFASMAFEHWGVDVACRCKLQYFQFVYLSNIYGGDGTLRKFLPRLRCEKCGERPYWVRWCEDSRWINRTAIGESRDSHVYQAFQISLDGVVPPSASPG